MAKNFIFFVLFLVIACSGTPVNQYQDSKTELVVHYNGKEVHRRSSYLTLTELTNLTEKKQEIVLIFSASWCSACNLTKKAISQANLKTEVRYLNIDEDWVKKLAAILEIQQVPTMVHVGRDGSFLRKEVGPGKIITYLLIKF